MRERRRWFMRNDIEMAMIVNAGWGGGGNAILGFEGNGLEARKRTSHY